MSRIPSFCLLGLLVLASRPAVGLAARLPEPGGTVRVAVPSSQARALRDAHVGVPFAVRLGRGDGDAPLEGAPGHGSSVLASVVSQDGGSTWLLSPREGVGDPRDSLTSCLRSGTWAADALSAAKVGVEVVGDGDIRVSFDRPVGPFPTLLSACSLQPTGPRAVRFRATSAVRLDIASAPGPEAPLLDGLDLVAESEQADVVLYSPQVGPGDFLPAPAPDLLLLLPDAASREHLPWKGSEGGARLRERLDPDLLAAVFWGGRGAAAVGALPPGVGPARPLPRRSDDAVRPLVLRDLPDDAVTLRIVHDAADPISRGLVERLAVVLRSEGLRSSVEPAERDALPSIRVLRRRAPTADPALALLALAEDGGLPVPLSLRGGLLSSDEEARVQAAALLERAWLREGLVIPVMTAEVGAVVAPTLRGVRVGRSGLPILLDAWWSGGER